VPAVALGNWPTPIQPLSLGEGLVKAGSADVFVKRDDLSSPVYGGNKVRTLEVLLGAARARGATHIWATGAFGSNHAVATILHAPRAGLVPGALLFPQPESFAALENLRVSVAHARPFVSLPHWSFLPFGIGMTLARARRAHERAVVMVPGGATPLGALGYVAAAFELARQVEAGALPLPARIVVGVGSTCTSAGLLAGIALASRLGVGFVRQGRPAPPRLVSVRVTPWPVTSAFRIVGLAVRASALLAELAGDASLRLDRRTLAPRLDVDGRFLGRGYGYPTAPGQDATRAFAAAHGPPLDSTYSAKSASWIFDHARRGGSGTTVYWATKSSAPLPASAVPESAPRAVRRWVERAEQLSQDPSDQP
jgi:D-cysteine desulfhydrase